MRQVRVPSCLDGLEVGCNARRQRQHTSSLQKGDPECDGKATGADTDKVPTSPASVRSMQAVLEMETCCSVREVILQCFVLCVCNKA